MGGGIEKNDDENPKINRWKVKQAWRRKQKNRTKGYVDKLIKYLSA